MQRAHYIAYIDAFRYWLGVTVRAAIVKIWC